LIYNQAWNCMKLFMGIRLQLTFIDNNFIERQLLSPLVVKVIHQQRAHSALSYQSENRFDNAMNFESIFPLFLITSTRSTKPTLERNRPANENRRCFCSMLVPNLVDRSRSHVELWVSCCSMALVHLRFCSYLRSS
jgi:hypothetical protein